MMEWLKDIFHPALCRTDRKRYEPEAETIQRERSRAQVALRRQHKAVDELRATMHDLLDKLDHKK
jgi:hypothetical protein